MEMEVEVGIGTDQLAKRLERGKAQCLGLLGTSLSLVVVLVHFPLAVSPYRDGVRVGVAQLCSGVSQTSVWAPAPPLPLWWLSL